jgi:hypothetical protein
MEEKEFLEDGTTPNPKFIKKEVPKVEEKPGEAPKTPKTFTEKEHQDELDRVAAKTRKEVQEKKEQEIADARQAARDEALEEAKLSEKEREKKRLEKEDKDRAEKDKKNTLRENTLDAKEKFDELKLPKALVDFVVVENKEEMTTKINSLKKAWDESIATEVAFQLKGGKPPVDPKLGNQTGKKDDEPAFMGI